jgi:glycerol-3-phosphate dehydrogenase
VRDINEALGRHRLAPSDVLGVFSGLLPEREDSTSSDVTLLKTARVVDHGAGDGMPGLYSIVGIKWTTARAVAERAINMACEWMGASPSPRTDRLLKLEVRGADSPAVLALIAQDSTLGERVVADVPVAKAQIVQAVRAEMARSLWDVIRRRVPLYLSQMLDARALGACAALMARELGWSAEETTKQIEHTTQSLDDFRGSPLRAAGTPASAPDEPATEHNVHLGAQCSPTTK